MANHRSIIRREERRRNRSKKTSRFHSGRLRLVIHKSLKHIEGQIIDDFNSLTIVSSSSRDKDLKLKVQKVNSKIEISELVGEAIAKKAKKKDIGPVVLDRNGATYHGRVKAFAEAARKNGLEI